MKHILIISIILITSPLLSHANEGIDTPGIVALKSTELERKLSIVQERMSQRIQDPNIGKKERDMIIKFRSLSKNKQLAIVANPGKDHKNTTESFSSLPKEQSKTLSIEAQDQAAHQKRKVKRKFNFSKTKDENNNKKGKPSPPSLSRDKDSK